MMEINFQRLIRQFVASGKRDSDELSDRQYCQLTAALIRQASFCSAWEFIINPPKCEALPWLLADFLEGKRNGPLALSSPAITLAMTMAKGAVCWAEAMIDTAIQEAIVAGQHQQSSGNDQTIVFLKPDIN